MNESIVPIYFFNFSKLLTKENGNYKIKTKTKKQKQKQTKQQHYLVHVEILFFSFKMNFFAHTIFTCKQFLNKWKIYWQNKFLTILRQRKRGKEGNGEKMGDSWDCINMYYVRNILQINRHNHNIYYRDVVFMQKSWYACSQDLHVKIQVSALIHFDTLRWPFMSNNW